jgi:hypothetical protein
MEEEQPEARQVISQPKLEGKINSTNVIGTFRTGSDLRDVPLVKIVLEGRDRPITISMDIIGDNQAIEGMLLNQTAIYEQERVIIPKESMYVNQKLTIDSGQLKDTSYEYVAAL